ncbi:hypothetical protein OIU78_022561, partial [Salix suchowensis]
MKRIGRMITTFRMKTGQVFFFLNNLKLGTLCSKIMLF